MKMSVLHAAAMGLLLIAAPVAAQPADGPGGPGLEGKMGEGRMGEGRMGEGRMMGRGGAFAGLSDEGKAVMRDAMRGGMEGRRAEREQIKAARDKMMALLEADKLDVNALKRAMDEERSIAATTQEKRAATMLAAYQKLSAEDRKAFVAGARETRERMQSRMGDRREQMRERMRDRRR